MTFINSKYNNFTVAVAVVFSICAIVYLFGKQANIMENFSDRWRLPERVKIPDKDTLRKNITERRQQATSAAAAAYRENSPEIIEGSRNEVEDRMLISKYRKSYEDTIIELDDVISMTILSEVCENAEKIAKNPTGSSAMIRKINDLKTFKDTLNEAMKTLDKK
jgi:hypothetical protein